MNFFNHFWTGCKAVKLLGQPSTEKNPEKSVNSGVFENGDEGGGAQWAKNHGAHYSN